MIRVPHRGKYIYVAWLNRQQHGHWRPKIVVWHGRDVQHMMPCWDKTVVAATLYNVPDGLAIDLEMDSEIPSKIRRSLHNQTTASRTVACQS